MMAESYQYKNLTSGPLVLPCKRGGLVTFAPGQWATDPWYSRFVGKGLTRVTPGSSHAVPTVPSSAALSAAVPPQQPTRMLQEIEPVEEERTEHWVRTSGIYTCRACSIFRTGSRATIIRHLAEYHSIDVEAKKQAVTVLSPPRPSEAAVPSILSVPSAVPVQPEAPKAVVPPAAAAPESSPAEPEKPVWACPDCNRRYASEAGLARHRREKHTA